MKRLLLVAAFVLLFVTAASAQVKVVGYAENGTTLTTAGISSTSKARKVCPSASLRVNLTGTATAATIYSDAGITPKANPFTVSATDGSFSFYVNSGRYDLVFSGGGCTGYTLSDFAVVDTAGGGFAPVCQGSNDTAAFSTIITSISTNTGAIILPYIAGSRCAVNNLTIPANVTLDNSTGTGISVNTGQTLTVLGPFRASVIKSFYNALSGQGTVSFAGNKTVRVFYPEWWGAVAGDGTDDFAAIQAAHTNGVAAVVSGVLEFGSGATAANYNVSAPIVISQVRGITWRGQGPDNTRITATGGQPAVQATSVWRSKFEGLMFLTSATISGKGVFELDGAVSFGTQGNHFERVFFNANLLAPYSLALNRGAGASYQNSENIWIDCNFDGATEACFYAPNGFNALNNTIIGGNFQSYPKNGIYLDAGSVRVESVGFQSTYAYAQVTNGGFDINASSAGTGEPLVVSACRTESWAFYKGSGSQTPVLIGNQQTAGGTGGSAWVALTSYVLNQFVVKADPTGVNQIYQVTTAGTSGASEPTWPASGTVADGSVVWTKRTFNVIDVTASGTAYLIANSFQVGNKLIGIIGGNPYRRVTADYTATIDDEFILVDATAGPVAVTLPIFGPFFPTRPYFGKRYYVVKADSSVNAVTVTNDGGGNIDGLGAPSIIPGGSPGFISLEKTTDASGGNAVFWSIARSFGSQRKGANVNSAAAIIPTGETFRVMGTTNITSITATGLTAGTIFTLIFDDVLTFTDGSNLKLSGNFVTTADDTITLRFDGTNFYEMSRSVN